MQPFLPIDLNFMRPGGSFKKPIEMYNSWFWIISPKIKFSFPAKFALNPTGLFSSDWSFTSLNECVFFQPFISSSNCFAIFFNGSNFEMAVRNCLKLQFDKNHQKSIFSVCWLIHGVGWPTRVNADVNFWKISILAIRNLKYCKNQKNVFPSKSAKSNVENNKYV